MPQLASIAAQAAPLPRKAKAAIVVQFLLNEGADVPLGQLPEDLQEELTLQMGAMRMVDRDTLRQVVQEFADEIDAVGLRFPGGIAGALSALDGRISPQTARRLRKEAGVRLSGDPWARIVDLPLDRLEAFALAESVEIAAVLLSKLDVSKAAQLLVRLPGDRARLITLTMSRTAQITPDAVDRIGLSLASQLEVEPKRAFSAKPDERLGAILNYAAAPKREEVLTGLDQDDTHFADAVRRAIFTFENIPERLAPNDVPKITRDVDQAQIVTAIAGASSPAEQATVTFILSNLSKRMAQTLSDDAQDRAKPRARDAEDAMSRIVSAIRDMQNSGEIELIQPDAPD
jgi:flagellar motor switch protein FliG